MTLLRSTNNPINPATIPLNEVVAGCYIGAGIRPGQTVAVAFSGGADSVALLAATVRAGYRAVALHCNFHLRGDESDRDERFARDFAASLGVEIRVVHFNVARRRAATGESMETACRELRYEWFHQQFEQASPDWKCVAIAHHANDNVETFFLNLLRGSGLRGLTAIPQRRDIFIRPLLNVTREQIMQWLAEAHLPFIVDSTNLLTDCRRNMLRNATLPAFTADFPRLNAAVTTTISNLQRDNELLNYFIEREGARITAPDGSIDLTMLDGIPQATTLLYHLLNRRFRHEFSHATAGEIIRRRTHTGATFHSADRSITLVIDRGRLHEVRSTAPGEVMLHVATLIECGRIHTPFGTLGARIISPEGFAPRRAPLTIWLDAGQLPPHATLTLRPRMHGDRIKPFGMRGSRLVSDIISDAKLPSADKTLAPVMLCNNEIVWVAGLRASRHFTVTAATTRILELHLTPTS